MDNKDIQELRDKIKEVNKSIREKLERLKNKPFNEREIADLMSKENDEIKAMCEEFYNNKDKANEIESDEIESDEIESDEIESDEIESDNE